MENIKDNLRFYYSRYIVPFFHLEKRFIAKRFKLRLGYEIDFKKPPITFNQKIQFRKLFDNNPLFPICADKYRVREYVKNKIGKKYLIPLYLVTEKLSEEDFEKLPNSFVIKTNHGSGSIELVYSKDKFDLKKIAEKFNNELKQKFGLHGFEYFYDKIPPRIVIEKFIFSNSGEPPFDYKFHCFKNKNKTDIIVQCDFDRFSNHGRIFYDENWNELDFRMRYPKYNKKLDKPINFEKMKELAKKLCQDFNYVRVDLYNLNGEIYFGELTFTHESGYIEFTPQEWDYKLGKMWNFEKINKKVFKNHEKV